MKERDMIRPFINGYNVRQRIENQMLCLTDLASAYEKERVANGWVEKRLDHFFNNQSEIEYVIELLELQGVFISVKKSTFIEQVKNQGLVKALKSIDQYKMLGRGENRAVFCNPYIFVAVAQWLNPRFRALVTLWVTDQLIISRIEAGNAYNDVCSAISKYIIPNLSDTAKKFIFPNVAKLMNKYIFGKHEDNLRQIASKEQLSEIKTMEAKVTALIEVGYLSSYQEIKDYLFTTK